MNTPAAGTLFRDDRLSIGEGETGDPFFDPAGSAWLDHYQTVARAHRKGRSRRLRPRLGTRRRRRLSVVAVGALGLLAVAILVVLLSV